MADGSLGPASSLHHLHNQPTSLMALSNFPSYSASLQHQLFTERTANSLVMTANSSRYDSSTPSLFLNYAL